MTTRLMRYFAVLAAVCSVAALAGCSPLATEPASTTVSPTPTTTAEPAGPEPILDASCADLLPETALADAFPAGVAEVDAAASVGTAGQVIPATYAIRSLGGIVCEFSNGEPSEIAGVGTNTAYVGARVLVLPDAASQWERFAESYGTNGEVGHYCSTEAVPLYCTTDELVGTTWVEVIALGAATSDSADALGDAAVAAVSDAPVVAEPWTPPSETSALVTECVGIISNEAIQEATGQTVPLRSVAPAGGWSIDAGAEENWGGPRCAWQYENLDVGIGFLSTLPAGAWAWAEASEFLDSPAPEALEVTGLPASDEAWLRCSPDDSTCVVDLILGGNWIQATLDQADPTFGEQYDVRDAATKIAEAIVAGPAR